MPDADKPDADKPTVPPMDADMKAYLDKAAKAAAGQPDPFTSPMHVARAAVEAAQRPMAEGGPEMAKTEEKWIFGPGRYVLNRVHYPNDRRPLPVLVFIHGGGWVWNSIYTHDRLAREYAARAGIAVISPDYSLSPEYKFPQALEECLAVVRWIAKNGHEWGLDGSRIVVGGDSAGGNLALATALALRDAGEDLLAGALLNYAVTDSNFDTGSYRLYGPGGFMLNRARMDFFWNCYTATPDQRTHPLAAPLRGDYRGLPPLRFNVAELDVLADENLAVHEKATQAGVESECVVYKGVIHGFMRSLAHVAKGEQAVADSADWLKRRLG